MMFYQPMGAIRLGERDMTRSFLGQSHPEPSPLSHDQCGMRKRATTISVYVRIWKWGGGSYACVCLAFLSPFSRKKTMGSEPFYSPPLIALLLSISPHTLAPPSYGERWHGRRDGSLHPLLSGACVCIIFPML